MLNAAATVLYFKQCGGTPTQEDGLAFNTAVSLTSKGTVMGSSSRLATLMARRAIAFERVLSERDQALGRVHPPDQFRCRQLWRYGRSRPIRLGSNLRGLWTACAEVSDLGSVPT